VYKMTSHDYQKQKSEFCSLNPEMPREKLGRAISRSVNSDESAKPLLSFGQ